MKLLAGRFQSLVKFMLAGLPAFALAVPLNYLLVDRMELSAPWAYFLVLLLQTSVNYLMCRFFVFTVPGGRASASEYLRFMAGILFFRGLDWLVYVVLVKYVGVYYLLAQVLNVAVFAVAKFLFAERLLTEPGRRLEGPRDEEKMPTPGDTPDPGTDRPSSGAGS